MSRGRKPRAERPEPSRKQLMAAAIDCFARLGYQGTTIDRIARDAVDGRALVAEAREAIDRRGHELLPRRLGPLGPRLAAARHTERSVSSLTRPVKVVESRGQPGRAHPAARPGPTMTRETQMPRGRSTTRISMAMCRPRRRRGLPRARARAAGATPSADPERL